MAMGKSGTNKQVMKKYLLRVINYLGSLLPKRIQRLIADFPGVLFLFQRLGRNVYEVLKTPEGYLLELNPLFHANLISKGSLTDYEPEMRKAIELATRPGQCAYDVGANVGVFSYQFASLVGPGGRVYAFEPEPNNSQCLSRSIALNDTSNIVLDTRALGSATKTEMFDRRGGAFSGRLVGTGSSHKPTKNLIQVETTSIDHLVEQEHYLAPDVIKIDVEGNERLVLEGMRNTLERNKPVIICELHGHLGDDVEAVFRLLKEFNYNIYSIADFINSNIRSTPLTSLGRIRHIVAVYPAGE